MVSLLDTKNEKRRIFLLEVTYLSVSSSFSAKLRAQRKVSRTVWTKITWYHFSTPLEVAYFAVSSRLRTMNQSRIKTE